MSDVTIRPQLDALKRDLDALEGNAPAMWPVANAFNTLLAQAKQAKPEDTTIGAVEPLEQASTESHSTTNVGTVRVLTGQLIACLPRARTGG